MFKNFISKVKTIFDKDEETEPRQETTASSERKKAKFKIFDQTKKSRNKRMTEHSDSILKDDLSGILSSRQLAFHFDNQLYNKMTKTHRSTDLQRYNPINSFTRKDHESLKNKLKIVANYQSIINTNKAKEEIKNVMSVNFSAQELLLFSSKDSIKVITFVFKKYQGLIERRGIFHNNIFIENELHSAKEYFSHLLLQKEKDYSTQIRGSRNEIEVLNKRSAIILFKVQQLRKIQEKLLICLMKKRKLDKNFKKCLSYEKMMLIISRLNEKFPRIVQQLERSFSVSNASDAYKSLLIAALYCIKKLEGGYKLFFIKKLYQRVEDRLLYLKHKLKQNLYYELKLNADGKKASMERIDKLIKQFSEIEKYAMQYYKPGKIDEQGFNSFIKKDTAIFLGYIKELEERTPFMLQDEYMRVRIIQLYNYYRLN